MDSRIITRAAFRRICWPRTVYFCLKIKPCVRFPIGVNVHSGIYKFKSIRTGIRVLSYSCQLVVFWLDYRKCYGGIYINVRCCTVTFPVLTDVQLNRDAGIKIDLISKTNFTKAGNSQGSAWPRESSSKAPAPTENGVWMKGFERESVFVRQKHLFSHYFPPPTWAPLRRRRGQFRPTSGVFSTVADGHGVQLASVRVKNGRGDVLCLKRCPFLLRVHGMEAVEAAGSGRIVCVHRGPSGAFLNGQECPATLRMHRRSTRTPVQGDASNREHLLFWCRSSVSV